MSFFYTEHLQLFVQKLHDQPLLIRDLLHSVKWVQGHSADCQNITSYVGQAHLERSTGLSVNGAKQQRAWSTFASSFAAHPLPSDFQVSSTFPGSFFEVQHLGELIMVKVTGRFRKILQKWLFWTSVEESLEAPSWPPATMKKVESFFLYKEHLKVRHAITLCIRPTVAAVNKDDHLPMVHSSSWQLAQFSDFAICIIPGVDVIHD